MNPNAQAQLRKSDLQELDRTTWETAWEHKGNRIATTLTRTSITRLVQSRITRLKSLNQKCDFIQDLHSKRFTPFSQAQNFYYYQAGIAEYQVIDKPEVASGETAINNSIGEYLPILSLFAKNTAPKSRITFEHTGDANIVTKIDISKAPMGGNNPGCLYVKVDGGYAGKITVEGHFKAISNSNPLTVAYLKELALNPSKCASKYGKRTGNCCFCRKKLTDPRSVFVGYGETCAQSWGLPWGEIVD